MGAITKTKDIEYYVNETEIEELSILALGTSSPGTKTVTVKYTGTRTANIQIALVDPNEEDTVTPEMMKLYYGGSEVSSPIDLEIMSPGDEDTFIIETDPEVLPVGNYDDVLILSAQEVTEEDILTFGFTEGNTLGYDSEEIAVDSEGSRLSSFEVVTTTLNLSDEGNYTVSGGSAYSISSGVILQPYEEASDPVDITNFTGDADTSGGVITLGLPG